MIRYELPYPPTTNNLFANAGNRRVKSKAYKAWSDAAGYSIIEQGRKRIHGHVTLSIALVKPDKRRRDLSNGIKAIEDLLVSMGVIDDDSLVQRISVQWVPDGAPCCVIIQEAAEALAA
jgi:Holliday junction resolvase RusA-like endonuclease